MNYIDTPTRCSGLGWSAVFNAKHAGSLQFSLDGRVVMESFGAAIGNLDESMANLVKFRPRWDSKFGWLTLAADSILPFGSEPLIKRSYEQFGRYFSVTTDFMIKKRYPMGRLALETLRFPGDWSRVSVVDFPEPGRPLSPARQLDLAADGVEFPQIPLVLLLEAADGQRLEVGCGWDLWRWAQAAGLGAKSSFKLVRDDSGITFTRELLRWEDGDHEMRDRTFRFNWYFAWDPIGAGAPFPAADGVLAHEGRRLQASSDAVACHTLSYANWPAEAMAGPDACHVASASLASLKSWVRRRLEACGGQTLCLDGLLPSACANASHLNRGPAALLHWDYHYLFTFWEWANRLLGVSGGALRLKLDPASPMAEMPSAATLRGVAVPDKGEIESL